MHTSAILTLQRKAHTYNPCTAKEAAVGSGAQDSSSQMLISKFYFLRWGYTCPEWALSHILKSQRSRGYGESIEMITPAKETIKTMSQPVLATEEFEEWTQTFTKT